MKILFVSPIGMIGGAERILLECVRQVRKLRPDWTVTVLMFAEGPLRDRVTELGAKAREKSRFCRWLRRHKPD